MEILSTPIPKSFKITNQYVWLPNLYKLPAQISYDVTCGSITDEFLPCFSLTKAEWDSELCDALSWYASPHRDDLTFRTNLFRHYPKIERLSTAFKATVGLKFTVSCSITSTSAIYSINGKPYATATYDKGKIPIEGYFGFAKYNSENITVENVQVTTKSKELNWSPTTWMKDLALEIQSKEIMRVAIPGTHDSGTYEINENSEDSPDSPSFVNTIKSWAGIKGVILLTPIVGPLLAITIAAFVKKNLNSIIADWAKSQQQNIGQQLNNGIRYLDLRVAEKSENEFHIVHSKYSANIDNILQDVANFVKTNPNEIIILDFNHFYNMTCKSHEELIKKIKGKIGDAMAPRSMTAKAKVNELWNANKSIIVLYSNEPSLKNNPNLWSENSIDSPWPNKTNVTDLKKELDSKLPNSKNVFFVLQGILTPSTKMIAEGLIPSSTYPSSLKELATQVTPKVGDWASKWTEKNVNIVIADWAEEYPDFVKNIVNLNIKSNNGNS